MSKDIEKCFKWAIKQNLRYLKNNTIAVGQGFINISNLLNNAEKEGYSINYEELKKEFEIESKKNITDFYNNIINTGDIVQLIDEPNIKGKCVNVDTEIISMVYNNNLYKVYCKNVTKILK